MSKQHPAALLFPVIDGKEFEELKESIRANGFDPLHPVLRWRGQTIDGRNRERAAEALGVTPKYKEIPEDADPWTIAWRANAIRRHLPADQKAAIYLAMLEQSGDLKRREKQKQAAQKSGGAEKQKGRGKREPSASHDAQGSRPKKLSADVAAEISVSAPTVERVLRLKREAPEAFEAVKNGATTVGAELRKLAPKPKASRVDESTTTEPHTAAPHLQTANAVPPNNVEYQADEATVGEDNCAGDIEGPGSTGRLAIDPHDDSELAVDELLEFIVAFLSRWPTDVSCKPILDVLKSQLAHAETMDRLFRERLAS